MKHEQLFDIRIEPKHWEMERRLVRLEMVFEELHERVEAMAAEIERLDRAKTNRRQPHALQQEKRSRKRRQAEIDPIVA